MEFWPKINIRGHKGRHGEFEPGPNLYSTPIFLDRLCLIRVYWNPKSRQDQGLGGLASHGASEYLKEIIVFCVESLKIGHHFIEYILEF